MNFLLRVWAGGLVPLASLLEYLNPSCVGIRHRHMREGELFPWPNEQFAGGSSSIPLSHPSELELSPQDREMLLLKWSGGSWEGEETDAGEKGVCYVRGLEALLMAKHTREDPSKTDVFKLAFILT